MLVCSCAGVQHPVGGDILPLWGPWWPWSAVLRSRHISPDWFPSTSVLSFPPFFLSSASPVSPPPGASLPTPLPAMKKNIMHGWRGGGAVVVVGELIHIAEDKCIFSTRLIPCTHFQAPSTSTSFYIPRSSRIIPSSSSSSSSPSAPPPVPPGWRETKEGSVSSFGTHRMPLFLFCFFLFQSGFRQWLARSGHGQARHSTSTHFRLCSNPIRGRAGVVLFFCFFVFFPTWQQVDECLKKIK